MKEHELYPFFLLFLNEKMEQLRISKSYYSLMKLSSSAFDDFKFKFENDELFNKKILELNKSELRDKKIDDIFYDEFD